MLETQPNIIVCIYESTRRISAEKRFERDFARLKDEGWSVRDKVARDKDWLGHPRTLTVTYTRDRDMEKPDPQRIIHIYDKKVAGSPTIMISDLPTSRPEKKPGSIALLWLVATALLSLSADSITVGDVLSSHYLQTPKQEIVAEDTRQRQPISGEPTSSFRPLSSGKTPTQPRHGDPPLDGLPPIDEGTRFLLEYIREVIKSDREFREALTNLVLYPQQKQNFEKNKHKIFLELIQKRLRTTPSLTDYIVVLLDENPLSI